MLHYIQAKHYSPHKDAREIKWIVMHSMEAGEYSTTAESVSRWFASEKAPKASAHFCVDNNSIVQCVRINDIAWHAPGANSHGIGVELAGFAKQTREQWLDDYSKKMLELAAGLVAALIVDYNIPNVFVDYEALRKDQHGITTHWEVTKAWHKTDHIDPGPNFPMDEFLAMVESYMVYPLLIDGKEIKYLL